MRLAQKPDLPVKDARALLPKQKAKECAKRSKWVTRIKIKG